MAYWVRLGVTDGYSHCPYLYCVMLRSRFIVSVENMAAWCVWSEMTERGFPLVLDVLDQGYRGGR